MCNDVHEDRSIYIIIKEKKKSRIYEFQPQIAIKHWGYSLFN